MQTAQISKIVRLEYRYNKKFMFWIYVRIVSAFGPLLATYIFAKGVAAIENELPLQQIIAVFVALMLVEIVDHLLRLSSKTRISICNESTILVLQRKFLKELKPLKKARRRTIQTVRNLSQSLRRFVEYMSNFGISAAVSFASIPAILFFIDKRIFALMMILIAIYLLVTFFFSRIYEKSYERVDRSRENYYAELLTGNNVGIQAHYLVQRYKKLHDVRFFDWFTLQNLVTIFNFIVVIIVVKDIVAGYSQIADLVLIVGYTRESKKFLNEITGSVNAYMQVKAGVERVAAVSEGKVKRIW